MGVFEKLFGSHREMDYNRLSGRIKNLYFIIRRGNVLRQLIDRTKWYLAPKFFYVVGFPTHIDIETSVSCQMRCPMCLRRQVDPKLLSGIMDFDLYKKIIDECSERGVYSVKLSWRGEPLLNPRIVEMVKYAKNRGIKDVAFLTNGERLSPELTVGLVEAGLDWISFSIDGLDDMYERIRYPATYEGIVKKVKYLKEYRDQRGRNKPLIRVQTIYSAIKENPSEYFRIWDKIADKVYVIADQVRGDRVRFPQDPNYVCLEPWRRITIGWNGVVQQCITDYEEFNSLGDVKNQSLYEIWHGAKFNELRDLIKNKKIYTNNLCSICHDTGIMCEEVMRINGKDIKICVYTDQVIDFKNMDARPKART